MKSNQLQYNKKKNPLYSKISHNIDEILLSRSFANNQLDRHVDKHHLHKRIVRPTTSNVDGTNPLSWPNINSNRLTSHNNSNLLDKHTDRQIDKYTDISQSNDTEIISLLKDYVKALESRVYTLENHISELTNNHSNKSDNDNKLVDRYIDKHIDKSIRSNRKQSDFTNTFDQIVYRDRDDVTRAITTIDSKIVNLRELFNIGDPFIRRTAAATKIISVIRGFIARRHLYNYKLSILTYKYNRCKPVIRLLDKMLNSFSYVSQVTSKLKVRRSMRFQLIIFQKWRFMTRSNAPHRLMVLQKAEEMYIYKRKEFMKIIFLAFHNSCVGSHSLRSLRNNRRLMIDNIRQDLHVKYQTKEIGGSMSPAIVTEEEVQLAYYRQIVLNFHNRSKLNLCRRIFQGFKQYVKYHRNNEKLANMKWFSRRAGACFYAWSDYTYEVGTGLQRKRWPGPRKYEIRYNQKRIDNFARQRLLLYVFKPLKAFCTLQLKVKKAFRRQGAKFLQKILYAWKDVSKRSRILRKDALSNWREYPITMTSNPFHQWKEYIQILKDRNKHINRLVNSYKLWKNKQKLRLIIRTWRHQALYGHVDGMYTRKMLITSLNEQKHHNNFLLKSLTNQTKSLEECQHFLTAEIKKRQEIEQSVRLIYADSQRYKMLTHHVSQELKRYQALVEAITIINPRQMQHLLKLQPQFEFKPRHIDLSIDIFTSLSNTLTFDKNKDTDNVVENKPITKNINTRVDNDSKDESEKEANDDTEKKLTILSNNEINEELNILDTTVKSDDKEKTIDQLTKDMTLGLSNDLPDEIIKEIEKQVNVTIKSNDLPETKDISLNNTDKTNNVNESIERTTKNDFHSDSNYQSKEGISLEDRILLDRVKWLITKFNGQVDTSVQLNHNNAVNSTPPSNANIIANPNKFTFNDKRNSTRNSIVSDTKKLYFETRKTSVYLSNHPMNTLPTNQTNPLSNYMNYHDNKPILFSNSNSPIPTVIVKMKGNKKVNKKIAFEKAITTATASALNAINERGVSQQTMLASDFLGTGSEFIASRMLIGIIDFLEKGDVSIFSQEDRKDWIKSVFIQSNESPSNSDQNVDITHNSGLLSPKRFARERGRHITERPMNDLTIVSYLLNSLKVKENPLESKLDSKVVSNEDSKVDITSNSNTNDKIVESVDKPSDTAINNTDNQSSYLSIDNYSSQLDRPMKSILDIEEYKSNMINDLWNNNLNKAVDTILSNNFNWRSAIMAIRSLHPSAGNYSGVGKPLDTDQTHMFSRIIDMKEQMVEIMQTQKQKFSNRLRTRLNKKTTVIDKQLKKNEVDQNQLVNKYYDILDSDNDSDNASNDSSDDDNTSNSSNDNNSDDELNDDKKRKNDKKFTEIYQADKYIETNIYAGNLTSILKENRELDKQKLQGNNDFNKIYDE